MLTPTRKQSARNVGLLFPKTTHAETKHEGVRYPCNQWAVLLYTGRSMCQRLFSENTLYWVKKLRETNVIDSVNSEMIWAT